MPTIEEEEDDISDQQEDGAANIDSPVLVCKRVAVAILKI